VATAWSLLKNLYNVIASQSRTKIGTKCGDLVKVRSVVGFQSIGTDALGQIWTSAAHQKQV